MKLRNTHPFKKGDKEIEAEKLVELNLAPSNAFNPISIKV